MNPQRAGDRSDHRATANRSDGADPNISPACPLASRDRSRGGSSARVWPRPPVGCFQSQGTGELGFPQRSPPHQCRNCCGGAVQSASDRDNADGPRADLLSVWRATHRPLAGSSERLNEEEAAPSVLCVDGLKSPHVAIAPRYWPRDPKVSRLLSGSGYRR